jgi:galactokinase
MSSRTETIQARFTELYGDGEPRLFRAPGRVNLIGEHTDYNDGFVLPLAIDRDVLYTARPRPDRTVRVHSLNLGESSQFSLDAIEHDSAHPWSDYVRGVAQLLVQRFPRLHGMDAVLESTVPIGAGLSSSAALEVATAITLLGLNGLEMETRELALLCQRAENEYVGARCGVMDQLASLFGQERKALLIDCRSLEIEPVPVLPRLAVVICDTLKRRTLGGSEYNVRRAQCEEGVRRLQQALPGIKALRDVSSQQFESLKASLSQPVRDRCEHVVFEDERVKATVAALRRRDLRAVGRLMAASHASLRDKFQVSCAELDTMVEMAAVAPGCIGTRMTGGGFGGCTVSLVEVEDAAAFQGRVAQEYRLRTGIEPTIYVTSPSAGAGEVALG